MAENQRSVGVIVAAYRAEATIARAVKSALAQPDVTEVIVVDDASGDSTLDAARAADDGTGRLIVLALSQNGGPSRARNEAVRTSKAAWLCVLDSDDFFEPGRIATLVDVALQGYDFVADDLYQVKEGAESGPRRALWYGDSPTSEDLTLTSFVLANVPNPKRLRGELGFIKPLMRRHFLDIHAITYNEKMRLGEDYDLYARALAAGARFRLVPAAGYISVWREGSLSGRHSRADLEQLFAADERLMGVPDLPPSALAALAAHARSTDKKIQWLKLIEAVKERDVLLALSCFARDPRVGAFLIGQLWGQVEARLLKRQP